MTKAERYKAKQRLRDAGRAASKEADRRREKLRQKTRREVAESVLKDIQAEAGYPMPEPSPHGRSDKES